MIEKARRMRKADRGNAWHDSHPAKVAPDFQATHRNTVGSNVKYEHRQSHGFAEGGSHYPFRGLLSGELWVHSADLRGRQRPLDVLVLCQEPVQPLALIQARAIGLMTMIDSGASDDKVSPWPPRSGV